MNKIIYICIYEEAYHGINPRCWLGDTTELEYLSIYS